MNIKAHRAEGYWLRHVVGLIVRWLIILKDLGKKVCLVELIFDTQSNLDLLGTYNQIPVCDSAVDFPEKKSCKRHYLLLP